MSMRKKDISGRMRSILQDRKLIRCLIYVHGFTSGQIRNWITGRYLPNIESLKIICEVSGYSANWILGLSDPEKPYLKGRSPQTAEIEGKGEF